MSFQQAFDWRWMAKQTVLGTAGVTAITAAGYLLHVDFAIAGCLYLLLVVLHSVFANFGSSAIVSVIAIVSLDYFFVPPVFTLRISNPVDGVALLTFLVTALVVTRLASKAREEARNADARRKDLARLYELALRLVSVGPDIAVKRKYLGIFRDIFALRAVCLFDGAAAAAATEGESAHDLVERTKEAYISGRDYDERKLAVRCLRVAGKPIGAIAFDGLNGAESTAGPLSVLAAAMVQRAHAFESASEAAAATQIEVLRSAILDAFAHQFKTPLASILTAAGSLRETGPLVPEQQEMVETIEAQAAGLGHLTTRLLRMARLDRDEIKPRTQVTDLTALVRRIADLGTNRTNGHVFTLNLAIGPVEVRSEPEMLSLAIIQLLDNAVRYSPPGSTITVVVDAEDDCASVRVTNEGSRVLPEEQDRIFDRFYRGIAGHQVAGTGLGLYVARKIAMAHGGTLEFDKRQRYGKNTTFVLELPVIRSEANDELKASSSAGRR